MSEKSMVLAFRMNELQTLMVYAGKSKNGEKTDLQNRAIELVRLNSPHINSKIRELSNQMYKSLGTAPVVNPVNNTAWACCYNCFKKMSDGGRFFVTKCRTVVCVECLDQCTKPSCKICTKACGVLEFNDEMPSEVKMMFSNVSKDVETLLESLKFQSARYTETFRSMDSRSREHQTDFDRSREKFETLSQAHKTIDKDMLDAQNEKEYLEQVIKKLSKGNAPAATSLPQLDLEKQTLAINLSEKTGMNVEFSAKLLNHHNWDSEKATADYLYSKKKGSIPPQAFIK